MAHKEDKQDLKFLTDAQKERLLSAVLKRARKDLTDGHPLTCTCPLHRLSKEERAELIDRAIDKTNEEFGIKKHDA